MVPCDASDSNPQRGLESDSTLLPPCKCGTLLPVFQLYKRLFSSLVTSTTAVIGILKLPGCCDAWPRRLCCAHWAECEVIFWETPSLPSPFVSPFKVLRSLLYAPLHHLFTEYLHTAHITSRWNTAVLFRCNTSGYEFSFMYFRSTVETFDNYDRYWQHWDLPIRNITFIFQAPGAEFDSEVWNSVRSTLEPLCTLMYGHRSRRGHNTGIFRKYV